MTRCRSVVGAGLVRRIALAALVLQFSLLALFPLAASAADDEEKNRFSEGDPALHRTEPDKGDSLLNRWEGKLPVAGTLVVRFDRSTHPKPKNASDLIEVTFTPDETSTTMFPRPTGSYQAPIADLYMSGDPQIMLRGLLGKKEADAVLHGSAIRYEWPVTLTVIEFRASIECDHRIYAMTQTALQIDAKHLNSAFGIPN